MHHPTKTLALALTLSIGSAAHAQLGPRPSEIPTTPPEAVEAQSDQADAQPSRSARARPAIDELLINRARTAEPAIEQIPSVSSGDESASSFLDDVRSGQTLPPIRTEQPATLVGGGGVEAPASGQGSFDKGWLQTIAALGGVLLLILGLSQLYKRLARSQGGLVGQIGAGGNAPTGILEVIGRYPIGTGMTLVVLKFDRRVLLIANGAATRGKHARGATMQTLCELSDPEDVASILLKARNASGESIAQSFERALQEADDLTDDSIYDYDEPVRPGGHASMPRQRREPVKTITSDEGDRAELWSTGATGQVAAGVLRKRLATMRRGNMDA